MNIQSSKKLESFIPHAMDEHFPPLQLAGKHIQFSKQSSKKKFW